MKKRFAVLLVFCLLFVGLLGCEKIGFLNFLKPKKADNEKIVPVLSAKGPLVLKVNNISIGLDDLNQDINAFNAMIPEDRPADKITTREAKIKYLKESLLYQILLYQEALDRGLDRSEEVMRVMEKNKRNILASYFLEQETKKIEVSAKDIEEAYNAAKEQLKEPEERQIREIVVPAEQEARDIMVQLLQGADFAVLAKERSKAVSGKNGGDLGFIQKGKKSTQFDAVAFSDSLEAGKISQIFKGTDGYYILKLEAKRGGQQPTFSEVRDGLKQFLIYSEQQKKMKELIDRLKGSDKTKIEIYEAEIK
ncbi:MAG: peptidyl-prolyl cis-trans isomerase [Candidatus Omnitrophota bacterium]|nr:peptidyl-prolyl cis-trans isomerase [Candidatus Omnitrophota bacterium]